MRIMQHLFPFDFGMGLDGFMMPLSGDAEGLKRKEESFLRGHKTLPSLVVIVNPNFSHMALRLVKIFQFFTSKIRWCSSYTIDGR